MPNLPSFIASHPGTSGGSGPQAVVPPNPPVSQAVAQPQAALHQGLSARPRSGPTSAVSVAGMAPRAAPWTAEAVVHHMYGLSDAPVKRWFKKPASEQYLYAKSLAPPERDELERALEQRFRNSEGPQAREALSRWLSVQQARLRTHRPGRPVAAALAGVLSRRRDDCASADRPEYRAAHENFLRVISDDSLPMDLRVTAAHRLAYHACSEETLTQGDSVGLRQAGNQDWMRYLRSVDPDGAPHLREVAGAFALAWAAADRGDLSFWVEDSADAVAQDIAHQTRPLGEQMGAWLTAAGAPGLPDLGAFDGEPLAGSFARLLARRQVSQEAAADAGTIMGEGVAVIYAIVQDPDLRCRVFAMAETALGSCDDKVAEGFSSIVRAVRNHQVAAWVDAGCIGAAELDRWARQQFRLDALEQEVHRFIERTLAQAGASLDANMQAILKALRPGGLIPGWDRPRLAKLASQRAGPGKIWHQLRHEPLETMLHAKVQLGLRLDLPDGLPRAMAHERESVLTAGDLRGIAEAIAAREADSAALKDFLSGNETWRVGMRTLHADADELGRLWKAYEDHPFWDEAPPPQDMESAAWQEAYNERAREIRRHTEGEEFKLLCRLAGLP